jgi:hypothetical protein
MSARRMEAPMKSTSKTKLTLAAPPKAAKTAARRKLMIEDDAKFRDIIARRRILMRFSDEQRTQIFRLQLAGGFASPEETVTAMAESALYVLGLDPIAWDSFDRLAKVVFVGDDGAAAYSGIVDRVGNEAREAGEAWTKAKRAAEVVSATAAEARA